MKKKILSILLVLCMVLNLAPSAAFAAEPVSYLDADGTAKPCTQYTVVTSGSASQWTGTTENPGWYIVKNDVTLGNVTVSGNVHLILADGCNLTVTGDITGGSLTIYGQANGTGNLIVSGSITGSNGSTSDDGDDMIGSSGSKGGGITINGGLVFQGNSGQVYGTSFTLSETLTIPAGKTLIIPAEKTLTISDDKTLINNGSIYVDGTLAGSVNSSSTGSIYYLLTLEGTTATGNTSDYNGKTYGKAESEITLNPVIPTGQKLTQWEVSGADVTVTDNTFNMPGAALTVTAQFSPKTYDVTLNTNGGAINSGDVTSYTYGTGATLPTDVTRTGYTFAGWYDNEALTGTSVTAISATDTENKKYWAKWTANQYTITYQGMDDATHGENHPEIHTLGTETVISNPTRTGYTFNGWKVNGRETPVQDLILGANDYTDAITLTATWTKNSTGSTSSGGGFSGTYNYPVRVDSTISGATVTLDKTNVVAGDKVTITVTPDAGKAVDEVIVTDADGKAIIVTKAGDNQYTFTMPAGKVNIDVITKAADYQNKIVLQIGNRNILENNKTITNDVAPIIVDNRTMVPIRVITEILGGTAHWNADTQTVTLNIDGRTLTMTIGQTISGFDTAPIIRNDRTYVPVRYVAEMLGAKVEWVGTMQQIIITK